MTPSAAQLLQIARDERARRKAAWATAGQSHTNRAMQDDMIWSNIEQMAGIEAKDSAALARQPRYWNQAQRIIMARSAWHTAVKAELTLGRDTPANVAKVRGLWSLYQWLRPLGWSPRTEPQEKVAAA